MLYMIFSVCITGTNRKFYFPFSFTFQLFFHVKSFHLSHRSVKIDVVCLSLFVLLAPIENFPFISLLFQLFFHGITLDVTNLRTKIQVIIFSDLRHWSPNQLRSNVCSSTHKWVLIHHTNCRIVTWSSLMKLFFK